MRRICWITESWALDTDINIVPYLKKLNDYHIDWYVLIKGKVIIPESSDYKILKTPYRLRDLRNIYEFIRIFRLMNIRDADIIYSSAMGIPFYYPILLTVKKKKQPLVHAAHNVIPYSVWPLSMKLTVKFLFKFNRQFQFFSRFTYDWFLKRYKNKQVFYAPMVIKDYGNVVTNNYNFDLNKINLLFFGNIAGNKRLDLLIDAVKSLPDDIRKKVHLNICGNCRENKDIFINQIDNDECISVYFKRIPDEDIPELFIKSSFLVLPYQDVAQSGPHMIAYNYNLPVIASSLSGFTERIINNVNGFVFEVGSKDALMEVIIKAVNLTTDEYCQMKCNLRTYVLENFSATSVANKYIEFFKSL